MQHDAHEAYLQTQILSAPPQKLQLMLTEGAIRFAKQAQQHWNQDLDEQASEALGRCQAVVAELLSGVQPDGSELNKKVTGLYVYLFRTLTDARLGCDEKKLAEAISVLQIERETWRQVCEKMPASPERYRNPQSEVTAGDMPAIPPLENPLGQPSNSVAAPRAANSSADNSPTQASGGGLSLEA